jgi:hypothetical protein
MARWIYGTSKESAPKSEQEAAELLQGLPAGFSVRWKFDYKDTRSGVWREGDFVIQGPDGHMLVLEVKGGQPSHNQVAKRWNTADGEDPFIQLDDEWAGVLADVMGMADKLGLSKPPFVERVLGLPNVDMPEGALLYEGYSRERVAARSDLENLSNWWIKRFEGKRLICTHQEARGLFNGLYAIGAPESFSSYSMDFADRIIERQTKCHYEILDALEGNHQLLFNGGAGTGKTWLGLELAARWAAEGKEVLFLCYNLELEEWLRVICPRKNRRIQALSYQSLAAKILGNPLKSNFKSIEEESAYFEEELPSELAEKTASGAFSPMYDALVVDEAQDHNTEPPLAGYPSSPGWWSVYLKLLRKGYESPIAIFHDRAQRLFLRKGDFRTESLYNHLERPVSVRLRHPVRYTRQLRRYFESLSCEATVDLLRDMKASGQVLPEGPDPQLIAGVGELEEGLRCADVIRSWIELGVAGPKDIMVLYPSSRVVPPWITQGKVHGISFHQGTRNVPEGAVVTVSINKAKGLERRAVVVIGLPDWADTSRDQYKARTFIQGVTRAQQLLAVITRPATEVKG